MVNYVIEHIENRPGYEGLCNWLSQTAYYCGYLVKESCENTDMIDYIQQQFQLERFKPVNKFIRGYWWPIYRDRKSNYGYRKRMQILKQLKIELESKLKKIK